MLQENGSQIVSRLVPINNSIISSVFLSKSFKWFTDAQWQWAPIATLGLSILSLSNNDCRVHFHIG